MKRTLLAFFALSITASAAPAYAQGNNADAERLFREGQQLMADKRFGEACPKFEDAYKKDNQLGTLLNLAYCHKEQGAIWPAWLEFKEAEMKAAELRRNDRKDFARQRMTELEKTLARASVESSKVDLTDVLIEDRRVPEAESGGVFAAEPGQRKITFKAKGKKPLTTMVTIVKGAKPQKITVPEMDDAPKEVPVAETQPADKDKPAKVVVVEQNDGANQRTLGLVIGGIGVVGVIVGGITGFMTLGSACAGSDPKAPAPGCTSTEFKNADTTGLVSTITLPLGGTALVVGAVLYFLAPKGGTQPSTSAASANANASRIRIVPQLGAGWAGAAATF